MSAGVRLLFARAPQDASWRAGFDLAQAAAALDVPLELGFAGAGLALILPPTHDADITDAGRAWASLELLGVAGVHAAGAPLAGLDRARAALPVTWLAADEWQDWLRRAPLQVW